MLKTDLIKKKKNTLSSNVSRDTCGLKSLLLPFRSIKRKREQRTKRITIKGIILVKIYSINDLASNPTTLYPITSTNSYHLTLIVTYCKNLFSFWTLFFCSFIVLELLPLISVQFSCSVVSDSLWPHGLQHARPPCLIAHSQSLVKLMSIESVMPSNHLVPCHPPSPPAFNLFQHQGLFKWVSSLHQMAKVLEFQLQHQSFQWIFRTDFV